MARRRLVIHIEYDYEEYDPALEIVMAKQRIDDLVGAMIEADMPAVWDVKYEWVEDSE